VGEVFARKEEEKKTDQLEHNKPCWLHHPIKYEEGLKYTVGLRIKTSMDIQKQGSTCLIYVI